MDGIEYGTVRIELVEGVGGRVDRALPGRREFGLRPHSRASADAPISLFGRGSEVEAARRAIEAGVPLEFVAPCGFGKSTLLRHLALDLGARFGAPAVFLGVWGQRPADILQCLTLALTVDDRPFRATRTQIRQLLNRVRPTVVLDDVTCDGDQLAELLADLVGCGVVLGTDRVRLGQDGRSQVLAGLSEADARVLLSSDLGRRLAGSELPEVGRLVAAVDGQPLRLRQAAALVRTADASFAALAAAAERDPAALDRAAIGGLAPVGRRTLAALALLGGALLPVDLVATISTVAQAADALSELKNRGLAERDGDRFGLPRCRTESYRAELVDSMDLGSTVRDLVGWLGAERPSSATSLSAADALLSLIGYTAERRDWDLVVRLVRVAEPILTLAGRWESCRLVLEIGIRAATAVGDIAAEGHFRHQQGTLAQCLDEVDVARLQLSRALELRERSGELVGAEVTRHNLRLLSSPPPPNTRPARPPAAGDAGADRPAPVGAERGRADRQKALALAASLLAAVVLVVTMAVHSGGAGTAVVLPAAIGTPSRPVTASPPTAVTSPPTTRAPTTSPGTTAGSPPGIRPPLLRSADPLSFKADLSPGQPAAHRSVTVVNLNDEPITLSAAQVAGDPAFSVYRDCRPHTIRVNSPCVLDVAFRPTTLGRHTGTLIVSDTAGRGSSLTLDGTGFAALTISNTTSQVVTATTIGAGVVNCPPACHIEVSDASRTSVTLAAPPPACSPDCNLIRWKGAGCEAAAPTCVINVRKDKTVTVTSEFVVG